MCPVICSGACTWLLESPIHFYTEKKPNKLLSLGSFQAWGLRSLQADPASLVRLLTQRGVVRACEGRSQSCHCGASDNLELTVAMARALVSQQG